MWSANLDCEKGLPQLHIGGKLQVVTSAGPAQSRLIEINDMTNLGQLISVCLL